MQVGVPDVDEVELEEPSANASVMLCSTRAAEGNKTVKYLRSMRFERDTHAPVITKAASRPSLFFDPCALGESEPFCGFKRGEGLSTAASRHASPLDVVLGLDVAVASTG